MVLFNMKKEHYIIPKVPQWFFRCASFIEGFYLTFSNTETLSFMESFYLSLIKGVVFQFYYMKLL